MKQTPIQKLIAKYEKEVSVNKNLLEDEDCDVMQLAIRKKIISLNVFISNLQSLLAEERQMVEDAYQTGGNNFDLDAGRPKPYPSDYFTQTYQQ